MKTFKFERFKAKTNTKTDRRTPKHYKTMRFGLILAALMFGGVFYGMAALNTPKTEAIEPSSFNAGYLIDDSVFYNPNTMTVAEIQKLLDDKSPACDMWGTGLITGRNYPDGTRVPYGTTRAQYAKIMREKYGKTKYHDPPYVCINKYYENPKTHQTLYETQGVATAGMKSAAQIIYDVAQEYNINPQVLLVMIKKESLVWGDNWPLKYEYNTVMGYGCPDGSPCNEAYYGFYNQVQKAAWQLNFYREHPNAYLYKPGQNNNIQYHPNTYCGTKQVYLENIATTSLYIYTPYTPNDAALRAYPGTGDGCSSYGNRNFYMFFREWFGDTYKTISNAKIANGIYSISPKKTNKRWLSALNNKTILSDGITSWSINLNDNGYYSIVDTKTGKFLTISEANAQLSVEDGKSNASQDWIISSNGDSTYTFYSAMNYNALDLYFNSSSVGTIIQNYNSNGSDAQKWTISLYVDDSSSSDGEEIIDEDLNDGLYYITQATNNKVAMGGESSEYIDGTNVLVGDLSSKYLPKWYVARDSNSSYYRIMDSSQKMSLDVFMASKSPGANIQLYTENYTCAQLWDIKKTNRGNYIIKSSCSGTPVGTNGTNVELINNSSIDELQKWSFKETTLEDNGGFSDLPSQDTDFYIASAIDKNAVVDIYLASKSNYANIQIYKKNGSVAQKWRLLKNSDDSYTFINPNSGKVLDIANARIASKTNIQLYESNSTCAQKWKLIRQDNGSYIIANACNEKQVLDLDDSRTSDGTNIQLYSRWGYNNNAQRWYLVTK